MLDTVILSVDDVRDVVTHIGLDALMDDVIARLEQTCERLQPDDFEVPVRDGFDDGTGGLIEWMPVMSDRRLATIKLVGYHPKNALSHGLPTILSVAMTFDVTTGHLIAVSDATFATAIRTAAASTVASKILAPPESSTLGLVGCGAQAISQLHGLSRAFPIERVLLHDLDTRVSATFASRAERLGLDGVSFEEVPLETLCHASDIICTATSVGVGDGPVLNGTALKPHAHINAVGSDLTGKTELPVHILKQSFVVADFKPQAMREGECQQLRPEDIGADMIELVKGADQFAAKRKSLTVFDSTGFALEDHIVIEALHAAARDLGLGMHCEIETAASDPTDPYAFISLSNGGSR